MKDLKDLHKTFWGTAEKCENKSLSYFLFLYNFQLRPPNIRNLCRILIKPFFFFTTLEIFKKNMKNQKFVNFCYRLVK